MDYTNTYNTKLYTPPPEPWLTYQSTYPPTGTAYGPRAPSFTHSTLGMYLGLLVLVAHAMFIPDG